VNLQESCKTVRRWKRAILFVKGGHCVGDLERGSIRVRTKHSI